MLPISGEQAIATILKHDNKTTSYKIALLRAINDLVLLYPDLARADQPVAVPLLRLAELWTAYYWPFADDVQPIYQGARATTRACSRPTPVRPRSPCPAGGPTSDTLQLLAYARRLPERLYEPGRLYAKAGVVLDGLEPPGHGQQLDLFAPASSPATNSLSDVRAQQLMRSLDALNWQFGRGTVRPAAAVPAAGQPAPWQGEAQHRSLAFTTRLEDLLVVG